MIQSYDQIKKQASYINEEIGENVFIQKIYSSSQFLCLTIRLMGVSKYLYIGRGAGFEGPWVSELRIEPFLRKRDKFLEYVRKHLGSSSFSSIQVDTDDRIFSINYGKWGRLNRFYIFYRARNLYFANHFYSRKQDRMEVFKSWTSKAEIADAVDFTLFDEVGRAPQAKRSNELEVLSIEKLISNERNKAKKSGGIKKSLKFLNRKRGRILSDLENIKDIPLILSEINKEEDWSSREHKITIGRIKIKFKSSDHFNRRDEVYLKIKKLNKAKKILELRLEDTQSNLSEHKVEIQVNNLKTINPVWKVAKISVPKKVSSVGGYKLLIFEGFTLGVGLTAQGNDLMRKEWAKKMDMWFHLEGDKSPHIIIKLQDNILSQDIMSIIAAVMIEYGKYEYTEANLIYTHVKNLKGVKGAAGKVICKKEKHIKIISNDRYRELLLS